MATWTSQQITANATGDIRLDAEYWMGLHADPAPDVDSHARIEILNEEFARLTAEANALEQCIESGRGEFANQNGSGWPAHPLGSLCNMHVGCDIRRQDCESEPSDDTYHVFRPGSVAVGGGLCLTGSKKHVSKGKCPNPRRFVLRKNDIVICLTEVGTAASRLTLLGHSAIIDKDDAYVLTRRTAKVMVKDAAVLDSKYLFHFINSPAFIGGLHKLATGTVQSNLSLPDIKKSMVVLPPIDEQRRIGAKLSAYHELLENNERRTLVIRELQRLLPMAMLQPFDEQRERAKVIADILLGTLGDDAEAMFQSLVDSE